MLASLATSMLLFGFKMSFLPKLHYLFEDKLRLELLHSVLTTRKTARQAAESFHLQFSKMRTSFCGSTPSRSFMGVDDVAIWLSGSVGLPEYREVFEQRGMVGENFASMCEESLELIGVTSSLDRDIILAHHAKLMESKGNIGDVSLKIRGMSIDPEYPSRTRRNGVVAELGEANEPFLAEALLPEVLSSPSVSAERPPAEEPPWERALDSYQSHVTLPDDRSDADPPVASTSLSSVFVELPDKNLSPRLSPAAVTDTSTRALHAAVPSLSLCQSHTAAVEPPNDSSCLDQNLQNSGNTGILPSPLPPTTPSQSDLARRQLRRALHRRLSVSVGNSALLPAQIFLKWHGDSALLGVASTRVGNSDSDQQTRAGLSPAPTVTGPSPSVADLDSAPRLSLRPTGHPFFSPAAPTEHPPAVANLESCGVPIDGKPGPGRPGLWERRLNRQKQTPALVTVGPVPVSQVPRVRTQYAALLRPEVWAKDHFGHHRLAARVEELLGSAWATLDRAQALAYAAEQRTEIAARIVPRLFAGMSETQNGTNLCDSMRRVSGEQWRPVQLRSAPSSEHQRSAQKKLRDRLRTRLARSQDSDASSQHECPVASSEVCYRDLAPWQRAELLLSPRGSPRASSEWPPAQEPPWDRTWDSSKGGMAWS
jgi:hypothetical protein